ncbi:E2 domain-containing protein [Sphingomonas sp. BK580]|uniref:E2 domain-containing protein n=1 Tax=Sphingomonas sp. BK580 TaxID=2586972 RepID=UPI0016130013|nr:E2 domain-containing protein [Sphingomonas sp. BK580]MBB3693537.1 hypothetical protein [Sphingomonas sp. BK580]
MTLGDALSASAPPWAAPLGAGGCEWIVAPPLPSGAVVPATLVRMWTEDGFMRVGERSPGTRLPRRCPELHVNGDSSFCLGRRGYRVEDAGELAVFWQDLGEWLVNEQRAERRGRWPAGRWLSHGPAAADRQADAEAGAAAIGMADEYARCIEVDDGWFAERLKEGGRRVRRGAACPRGCLDLTGSPVRFDACRHRASVERVLAAERARRQAEADYFAAARRAGYRCCGRMPGCPLIDRRMVA